MKNIFKILAISILLITSYIKATAQTDTEFWFCVPQVTWQHEGDIPKLLITATDIDADVTIEMPMESNFTKTTLHIPANTSQTFKFDDYMQCPSQGAKKGTHQEDNILESGLYGESCSIKNKGIHITSTALITAYLERGWTNNDDIWALKGKNAFGTEFIVPSQNTYNNHNFGSTLTQENPNAWNAIDIVAVEDCEVTIDLTAAISNYNKLTGNTTTANNLIRNWTASWGSKHKFTLKKGQTLNLQAKSQAASMHLGGTIITSTGNIAVQWKDDSLHTQETSIYSGEGGCYDIIGDQLVPTKLAGLEYIVMRGQLGHGGYKKGEYVYLMSTSDDTTNITATAANGDIIDVPSLTGKGSMTKILLNSMQVDVEPKKNYDALHIKATKPIIVMHIAGFGCEVGGAILPTINGCTGSNTVSVCRSTSEGFFLNIMCKAAHINDFTIKVNGNNYTIPSSWFKEIPNTGWYYLTRDHVEFGKANGNIPAVNTGSVVTVSNSTGLFHLAIINGGTASGCRYGYFSNFSDDYGHAVTISEDFESDYRRYCYGDTIRLQATGGVAYLWKYSQGIADYDTFLSEADKTSSTPRVQPPTGTNVYQVTIWRACYLGTDVDTTINVWTYGYNKINADFEKTELSNCSPKGVVIDNKSTGGTIYSWRLNDGTEEKVVSEDKDYGKDTIYFENKTASKSKYKLTLKTSIGYNCPDTASKSFDVCPEVTTTITPTSAKGCQPLTVNYECTFSVAVDYAELDFGDGSEKKVYASRAELESAMTNGVLKVTHAYNNSSTADKIYTATITARDVTNGGGCSATASAQIKVYGMVKALFAIDKAVGCSPLDVNFTNYSIGDNNTLYTWENVGTPSAGTIPAANSAKTNFKLTYKNTTSEPTIYTSIKLTAERRNTDNSVCTDVMVSTDTITVNPEFKVDYTATPLTGCDSLEVTFTNKSSDLRTGTQFKWDLGDGASGGSSTVQNSSSTFKHIYSHFKPDYQEYQPILMGESKWGCRDTISKEKITVAPYINPNFTIDKTSGCSPLTVHIINNTPAHASKAYGTWSYSQNPTQGEVQISDNADLTFTNTTGSVQKITITLTDNINGTCAKTYSQVIEVYPEITAAISADKAEVCNNTEVTFTNSSVFTGQTTTPTEYRWDFGDGSTGKTTTNANVTHTFKNSDENSGTTAKSYTVTLTAVANGCASKPATQNVKVYPPVNAAFSAASFNVCAPATVMLTNQSTGADSYTWSFSDGTADITTKETSYSITNTSDQIQAKLVTLTAYNSNMATCNSSISKTFNAYPTITPSVSVDKANGCGPLDVKISQSVTSPSVAYTYKLNFGDQETDETGAATIQHTFRNEGQSGVAGTDKTYTITATYTNNLGCSASASTNVTVYPEISPSFTFVKETECSPMNVTLINSTINGTRFDWTFGDGQSETKNNNLQFKHQYTNSSADGNSISTYTIKMVAIDANHTECRDSSTINIDIYPQVIAAFDTENATGCSPLTTTFTNNSKGYGLTYLWDYAHDNVQSATTDNRHTHTFDNLEAATHTYNVTLTATDVNNCQSTATKPVNAYPHVVANFAFAKDEVCTPYPVTFSYPAAINGNKFEWDFGYGGHTATKTDKSDFKFTFDNTELETINHYTIKMKASDTQTGCADSTAQVIEVYPRLRPKFIADVYEGCDPLTVQFTNQTTGRADYLWDFGDSQQATEPNPSHIFNHYEISDQTYTVKLRTTQTATSCAKTVDTTITAYSYVLAKFGLTEVSANANGGADKILGGCTPFEVMITDSSRNIGTGTWSWNYGDGNTSTSRQPSRRTYTNDDNTAPLENKNYTIGLTVTNMHGCQNHTEQTLAVYPRSVPDFDANFTGCEPLTVNFTDKSIVDDASRYYWTFSDGATSVQEPPFSKVFHNYSYTNDLKFTANLKTTTKYNCTDEITKEITVYPKPLANFMPLIDRACPPFEAEFANYSKGTGLTYNWNFDNGIKRSNTSTANQKVEYSNDTDAPITRNVELIVESDHGCRDTMVNPMITFPNVIVDFSFDTAGCSPHTISINNQSTSTTEYHLWDFGEGSTSVAAEPTFTYYNTTDNDQVLTITYIGTSKYQCADTISKKVTVYINPNVDFVAHTPSQRYPDDTVYFENYTQDGPWKYLWDFGDGNTSTTDEKYFMYKYGRWGSNDADNIFHVTLHIESEHCENTTTHDVTILPPYPKIEILNQKPAGCVPLTVDFRIKEEYCNTFEWTFEDGTTSTEAQPTHTFTEPGIYNVKLTAEGDGGSHYDYEIITVYELPTPDFVATPTFVMLPNQPVQFFNSTLNGNTYIWDFGDGTYSTDLNPTHQYTKEGIYDVKLIAYSTQMCIDSVIKLQSIEVSGAGSIRFPNAFIGTKESPEDGSYPVPDDLNNVFHPIWHGIKDYDLWIFNRWGEQLFHSTDVNKGWNGRYGNTGKELGQDVYFWKAKGTFLNGTPFKIAGDVTLIRK